MRPKDIEDFHFWITLEILLLLAIAITNFIFLFTRSFIVPALDVDTKEWYDKKYDNEETKKSIKENKDFMQSHILEIGVFATFGAPLVISGLLFMDRLHFYDLATDDEKRSLYFMVVIQALQLFFSWFLTFFASDLNNAIKIITAIMFACLAILFPLVTMICVLVFHGNGTIEDTTMSTWFWIYFSLQAILLLTVLSYGLISYIIARRNQANG